jgi:hypothetical protein
LFLDIFKKHEDIANWSEAAEVIEPNYYNSGIDHIKLASDVNESDARRIKFLFGIFTRLKGKKRFLNKHPQNSLRIPYLDLIFPDAIYIHLIRDGRATVLSNISQIKKDKYRQKLPFGSFPKPDKWRDYTGKDYLEQFAYQWKFVIQYIRDSIKKLDNDGRYLEVKYEEFCNNPRSILNIIDEFCGLSKTGRNLDMVPEKFNVRSKFDSTEFSKSEKARLSKSINEFNQKLGYR